MRINTRIRRAGVLLALVFALAPSIASAAPKAYVGNFGDNSVSVIDTGTRKVVATIPVAAGPHGMAVSPDGRWVYVSGDASRLVNVIDTMMDRVVRTIDVGKAPNGIALTGDGKTLLVTVNEEDRVAFINTTTFAIVGNAAVPKPHTIAIRPDGKLAYVTSQEPGNSRLAVIDLATRTVIRTVALDHVPRDGEFASDGKTLYFTEAGVNAVQVLDSQSESVRAQIATGVAPHYVNLFAGMKLGVIVVQGPGEVLLFDPATNAGIRAIPVGKQPHWLALAGDAQTAYVTNEGSNDVSIVNLSNGQTVTVPVGKSPRKVAVQPAETASPDAANVKISGFAFGPEAVTITTGQSVTWTNSDGAAHTVTFKDGSTSSRGLSPGDTFRRVFDRPGTYNYACSYHPYMTGRVIVTPR